jgi:LytS/YehU family sensor histidine kinase
MELAWLNEIYTCSFVAKVAMLVSFVLVFMISTGTRIITFWFDTEQRKKQAEKEKVDAELTALKAQINPHFLFNTLNSIYYMSIQKSDDAPETIIKLSDLMRFVLTETQAQFIPLNKEIECINQYIDLQAMRLPKKTVVDFKVEGDIEQQIIAPLMLLPFVENAFKHGVSTHVESKILIHLDVKKDWLLFHAENKKEHQTIKKSTRIGLSNVVRRLELTYPQKHNLKIDESGNTFKVDLKINLS